MSDWALSEIAELNPAVPIPAGVSATDAVSFIPMNDVSESGQWLFRQTRPLCTVVAGFTTFSEGDVLVAKITPCMENGKGAHAVGLKNGIGFGSTEFHVLRARPCNQSRFVFHVTQWRMFRHAAARQMVGSAGQQRVQRQFFDEFRVAAFSPAEQVQVAMILDTLDAAIHETEAIVEKLKQVKQGLLHDLLTRGLDANGELRPSYEEAPDLYQDSPLGWIPKDWTHTPLGQILAEPTRSGLYKQSSFRGHGPLMVQMGGLFRGDAVDYRTASRAQVTGSELAQFGLALGDLLFARRSLTFEGAGLCVIVRDLPELATFESSIVRARLDHSKALPEFVNSYLRGERSACQRRTFIRQVAVSGVSSTDIAQFQIALPKKGEQQLIIDLYAAASGQIDREEAALNKLKQQKVGLMDDLLTGRVRVTPLLAQ
jgi:type I restriction enzyme S subunit